MDATISLHTSGRRSSWFSNRSFYAPLLLLLALAIFGSFGFLILSIRQSLIPVEESLARLNLINQVVQQTATARPLLEHARTADDSIAFASAEQVLLQTVDAIEQSQSQLADYFALSNLEQLSIDYLNNLRSLRSVTSSGAPVATQNILRQQLDKTALALDEEESQVVASSLTAVNEHLDSAYTSVVTEGMLLLPMVAILFGAFAALTLLAARRSVHPLEQIMQGAQRLAEGEYNTRIDLVGEQDLHLVQLVKALNRIAELLKAATQSESAANKQNHLQIMKLARQERMNAVLEERQRIARELHDSVKQQLFSITLSAGAAVNLLEHTPNLAKNHLEHIQQSGHSAQAEMTALIQELVPVSLQEQRLEEALLGYLNPLCETHGLKLLWRVNGTNTLTIAQEHALLRAVQEAVSNVIRHSSATMVRVSFSFGLITHVIVEDNGEGFLPEAVPATATGLSLMRTRLQRVGGRCELQTSPGMGTRLTILLDLRRIALPFA